MSEEARLGREQVSRALAGDEAAMDRLVAHWLPTVYAWCSRLGRPTVDAEEAAHDVLLTLVRRRDTIASPAQLPAWLFATCRGVVANHRRRTWWRRWVPGVFVDERRSPDRTDGAADERELVAAIDRALDALPLQQREVLVLCYLEERSVAEAAALLGVPEGTVKSRLFTARGRFQAVYGETP